MRLFVAIPLEENVKEELVRLADELKSSRTKMKLVEKENMHMTLRFIGEGKPGKWERLLNKINEKPFDILFDRVGAFPSVEHPRVIWAGRTKTAITTL